MSLIYLQKSTNKNGTRDFPSHHSLEIRKSAIFFSIIYVMDRCEVLAIGRPESAALTLMMECR